MIEIREARFEDAVFVAHRLRDADKKELRASSPDSDPASCVLNSWQSSDWCKIALVDGEPAVIWGVAPCPAVGEKYGSPWLLATEKITEIRRGFIEHCKQEIAQVMSSYPHLFNYVHKDNALSQQWLQWLGFVMHKEPTGNNNEFFLFTSKEFCCV